MVSVESGIDLFECNPGDFSIVAVHVYLKGEVANAFSPVLTVDASYVKKLR